MAESNGPEDSGDHIRNEWDSDEALEFIKMERSVVTESELSDVELTRKLIEQAAPMAAVSMIHLSRHAQNENTRMSASKWVVEFATQIETEDGRAAWEKMLPDMVEEAEKLTKAAAASGSSHNPLDPPSPTSGGYEIGD